ncbi:MAG: hypothetical protein ACLS3M_11795 [Collinsella sp.]
MLLAQVADEFYPILNEQHQDVQVDVREDLTVLVDGDKMARVFNNIMKNAIAYSYEGSTITIEASAKMTVACKFALSIRVIRFRRLSSR